MKNLSFVTILGLIALLQECPLVTGGCINVKKLNLCDGTLLTMPKSYGKCGDEVPTHIVHKQPVISYHNARPSQNYILLLVDPDAPNAKNPTMAYWRHWVLADIKGGDLKNGDLKGNTLTAYAGPTPPQGTGLHRYQFLLFEQPEDYESEKDKTTTRAKFDLQKFIEDNKHDKLCYNLKAVYQYQCEYDKEDSQSSD